MTPSRGATAARSCPFCAIVDRTAPASVVWRDERVVGFLDLRPLFKGHVLLVPVHHVATYDELPADVVPHLALVTQRVQVAVQAACEADGSMLLVNNVVSQSVPHLHQHVIPRRRGDGLRIWLGPRHPYASVDEREEVAARIRAALEAAGGQSASA